MATVGGQISHVPMTSDEKRVIFASSLGTVFEWYDFFLAGSLAAFISKSFFSGVNPTAAFIFTLLSFAAGFAVRPFGAIVFGRLGDLVGGDPGEVVPLATREHGDRDLVRLGRGEEELDVLGRLLERLEQGVERPGREHVDFVDVINLEPGPAGAQAGILPQFADGLDAIIAGAVDLDHVDILSGRDRLADVADIARFFGRPLDAI